MNFLQIQEIKRAENLPADVDEAAISTNAFEPFQSHHELSSVHFPHSEPPSNYSAAAINEMLHPKPPLTLLKRDVMHKRPVILTRANLSYSNDAKHTIINQERTYRSVIRSKTITPHRMLKEDRFTSNKALTKLFQRRKIKENSKRPFRKRKRIKPRLSVTIPETKLFPKKTHFIVRSSLIEAKKSTFKTKETKNKNYLTEMKTKSLKELKRNREVVAQSKSDKDCKSNMTSTNYSNKLNLQFKSLSNGEFPIGLCNKGIINTDRMSNSPARITPNFSYTFDTDFAAIQKYLDNLASKGNNKAQWIQEQGYGSEEDDGGTRFPKKNSTPWCYIIDDKEKPNGKLVLKIRRMPSNPQMEAEISREKEILEITDQLDGKNEENVTTEKNFTVNTLNKISESTHPELKDLVIDVTGSKEIQFIDDCYRSILKDATTKMNGLLELNYGTGSEISGNNDFTKANEGNENYKTPDGSTSSSICKKPKRDISSVNNITFFKGSSCSKDFSLQTDVFSLQRHYQGDPYELLYEDFTKYYNIVFDGETNVMCSEMGELLEYIVAKEDILLDEQVNAGLNISHSGSSTANIYNKIGQDKIKDFNKLFFRIYENICDVTDNVKQRKILLITCFVKMKSRISSIAIRAWTLKETRLHLITFLSQDILHLPLVGEVFFMQEETFLQDCMMVVDYTLKCMNNVQEPRKEFYKSKENDDRMAPMKSHNLFINNQHNSSSTNIVQCTNTESSINCPNSMSNNCILENVQTREYNNRNSANFSSKNSNKETCINGKSKKPHRENELNLGKESSEDISYFHPFEESLCIEKQIEPSNLNICNNRVNLESQVKKVSTLVQTLWEAHKNSSAEEMEKLVENIRIGSVDLDYASCKIMQILRETGNFDEQYSLHNKIDALIKTFNTSDRSLSATNESITTSF